MRNPWIFKDFGFEAFQSERMCPKGFLKCYSRLERENRAFECRVERRGRGEIIRVVFADVDDKDEELQDRLENVEVLFFLGLRANGLQLLEEGLHDVSSMHNRALDVVLPGKHGLARRSAGNPVVVFDSDAIIQYYGVLLEKYEQIGVPFRILKRPQKCLNF